jgi:elongation factor Ts
MTITISASDVKKLRDQTGAGMMDCKSALTEADGNFEEATTILRKKGLASAAKKAGRATNEGLIGSRISADHSTGTLVEVNCESDFVARTDEFKQLVEDVLTEIDKAGDAATQAWLDNPDGPVKKRVAMTVGKLGENMAAPRFVRFTGKGYVGHYIHMGGKIGVQVELAGVTPQTSAQEALAELVKQIAMHIAAASPSYVSRAAVPADVIEREKSIYRAQLEGKPANVLEKIIEGKLGSFYASVPGGVLTDQPSIFDQKGKTSVADMIAAASKALGAPITVTRFARLKVGEGA